MVLVARKISITTTTLLEAYPFVRKLDGLRVRAMYRGDYSQNRLTDLKVARFRSLETSDQKPETIIIFAL